MASNQDIYELIRLLVEQQQQQEGVHPSPAFQPQLQPAPPSSSPNTGALGLLESAVLGIITSGSSAREPNANAPFQGNSVARTSYAVNDSNNHHQQHQLIQTARQLSAINPSLAATVAEYAMSLEIQQPQYSQQDPVSNMDGSNSSNPLSTYTNTSAPSNQNVCTTQKDPGSSNATDPSKRENISILVKAPLPQKPVSLLTLQGWSLEQLGKFESNTFTLQECC
jgi:hypothetical protein